MLFYFVLFYFVEFPSASSTAAWTLSVEPKNDRRPPKRRTPCRSWRSRTPRAFTFAASARARSRTRVNCLLSRWPKQTTTVDRKRETWMISWWMTSAWWTRIRFFCCIFPCRRTFQVSKRGERLAVLETVLGGRMSDLLPEKADSPNSVEGERLSNDGHIRKIYLHKIFPTAQSGVFRR